jgi:cation diffusion facilitator family transporter
VHQIARQPDAPKPWRYALISVAAALVTMGMKFGAYALTGSVGLLSDALESCVNLMAGVMVLFTLVVARKPADTRHPYGHGKAEFLASGIEGILILVAAAGIVLASIDRFLHPEELTGLNLGLLIALAASAVNFGASRILRKGADVHDSIVLHSDAAHLMSDVFTSIGVVVGLGVLLLAPHFTFLDPLIAVILAANIGRTGVRLVQESVSSLLDEALPDEEVEAVREAVLAAVGDTDRVHALRSRKSGHRRFIDFHLVTPGKTSVKEAHDLCLEIEREIRRRLARTQVTIHVEPIEEQNGEESPLSEGHEPVP